MVFERLMENRAVKIVVKAVYSLIMNPLEVIASCLIAVAILFFVTLTMGSYVADLYFATTLLVCGTFFLCGFALFELCYTVISFALSKHSKRRIH